MLPGAKDWDLNMAKARKKLDWEEQMNFSYRPTNSYVKDALHAIQKAQLLALCVAIIVLLKSSINTSVLQSNIVNLKMQDNPCIFSIHYDKIFIDILISHKIIDERRYCYE